MRVDVCICTFRRPQVTETLASVEAARRPENLRMRIIVVDNDDRPTAKSRVTEAAAAMTIPVRYLHIPGANISIARNAALDAADADWIAFLDDDEIAESEWLDTLIARQGATGADAVFGRSKAVYGPDAAAWLRVGDFHSQSPVTRRGTVETGHTCNALLRWNGAPWVGERFDPGRGRSGGEDTEFFFRLRRRGARYAIAPDSIVREAVPADRATLDWLLRRRFRIGQSHASSAKGFVAQVRLFGAAGVKSIYCHLRALPARRRMEARAFWLMRGRMHLGVCAGCLGLRQRRLYGERDGAS